MEILNSQDVRALDQRAIHQYGIPSKQLMKQAANCIKERIDELDAVKKHILIVCGPGNNGGDGFALAVLLKQAGYLHIQILCNVLNEKMSEDERYYAKLAQEENITLFQNLEEDALSDLIAKQDILIDALFGTGLSRNLQGEYANIIEMMNASDAYLISVDMPSGIHSDSGVVMGCAVCADETLTFACLKPGQLIYPGSSYVQRLRVCDIGIPQQAYVGMDCIHVMDDETGCAFLPKRKAHSHKGSYGKVLAIGGSIAMHGALTLTAKSMLRSGVGTLTLFVPQDIVEILAMKMEECMLIAAPSQNGFFSEEAAALLQERIQEYDVIVIGNGLGRSVAADQLVEIVLRSNLPCLIDGDGLFSCAKYKELLSKRTADCILTPHPKEMSYLSGVTVQEICADPFTVSKQFILKYPTTTLVMKDQYTIIRNQTGSYLNMAGNNALAKGGSGDVLCGIIAGLYAQERKALEMAALGVYVHASCSDLLVESQDVNSILPSDLIMALSSIYKRLRSMKILPPYVYKGVY